jgi:hypothetical protein
MKPCTVLLRLAGAAVLAALAFSVTGCTTVEPWQRGNLADYTMRADRDPLQGPMTEHIYFSREASSGGRGVGGGGCGCN